jgi:hypothetical protein
MAAIPASLFGRCRQLSSMCLRDKTGGWIEVGYGEERAGSFHVGSGLQIKAPGPRLDVQLELRPAG